MINKKWDEILKDEFKKPYFKKLGVFVKNEYGKKTVYPEYKNIFNALRYTKSSYFRSRSISWTKRSSRTIFFCRRRS